MAGLSRAKAASIQILRTSELKASECKRPNITQFHVRTAPSQVAASRQCPEPAHRGCLGPLRLAPVASPRWERRLSGHSGARRCQQGSAGQPCPSDTLQTHKTYLLPRPLPSPCRRKRSSSRSPTASSRRRRPTRPPSRRRPRRPSSVRWIHRYVSSCASGEYRSNKHESVSSIRH